MLMKSKLFDLALPPYAMTSYGRLIRRPRFWAVAQTVDSLCPPEEEGLLVNVEYDQELCLLIIVHYRPVGYFSSGWGKHFYGYSEEQNSNPKQLCVAGTFEIVQNFTCNSLILRRIFECRPCLV